jgi:hypothetical protein
MRTITAVSLALAVGLGFGCSDSATEPPNPETSGTSNKPTLAGQPNNSEQVIFSGVAGAASSFPNNSPAGFWIWCEAESDNPYEEECNGAMYFYALGITRHVEGDVSEPSDGIYEMVVSSTRDGAIVNCVLTNADEAVHGPHNTVTVSCDTPGGSATSTNAVVNVTGPPED